MLCLRSKRGYLDDFLILWNATRQQNTSSNVSVYLVYRVCGLGTKAIDGGAPSLIGNTLAVF